MAIIITICLTISFISIYFLQKRSLGLENKYPKINCKEFDLDYVGKKEAFQREAINEYLHNLNAVETHFTGPLQCFCQLEKKEGAPNGKQYTLTGAKGSTLYEGPICKQYFRDIIMSKIMG